MSDPIDMLEDMFQSGEEGEYFRGDTVMQKLSDEYITFKAVSGSRTDDLSRIVSRADRPKWHTSDAVIADLFGEQFVWIRDVNDGMWLEPFNGHVYSSGELDNVTPLIEAKVTDEMIERGQHIGVKGRKPDAELVRRVLTAALGIVTE